MSGEKPAPTAAEVAAARTWFEGAALESFADVGFPETARHVRTLLAALDAAEARATAAEKDAAVNEKFYVETCASLSRERTRALTAERDRDELRDALKLYEAFPELATGDTARRDEQRAAYNGLRWVLGLLAGLDDGRQDSVAKAFRPVVEKIKRERDEARAALKPGAIVVSDSEETRERIARALYVLEGGNIDAWHLEQDARRSGREGARAALAALRESRP